MRLVPPKLKIGITLGAAAAATALSVSLAGAVDPDLETKLASARDEASLITDRISSQTARIGELEQRADDAAAREQELPGAAPSRRPRARPSSTTS